MGDDDLGPYFALFTEISIIQQLSSATLEARLPGGVLASHFGVLSHLVRVGDGETPLMLATTFQTPKTTMSHTLAGLEKRGLVELRPNPRDGRSKCVWITEAGREFRANAITALGPDLRRIAERFPLDAVQRLATDLAEIRAFLDAERQLEREG